MPEAIINAVRHGLDNLEWAETPDVKTKLCKIGRELGYSVGARANEVPKCAREWGGVEAIDDDVQKLLLARASLRLMIFDGTYPPYSDEIANNLGRQASRFRRSCVEDAWLLAAWERTDEKARGWRFPYLTTDEGAAREL